MLLGLGGAIYPPVWLLGAAVALASRLWDYKDKWIGLAVPPLLTLIGIVVGVARAGDVSVAHSVHEGWVYGVHREPYRGRTRRVLPRLAEPARPAAARRPALERPHKIG